MTRRAPHGARDITRDLLRAIEGTRLFQRSIAPEADALRSAGLELQRTGQAWLDSDGSTRRDMALARALRVWLALSSGGAVRIGEQLYTVPRNTQVHRAEVALARAGRAWIDSTKPSPRLDGRLVRALRAWLELNA